VTLDDANDLTPQIKAAAQEELKKFRLGPLYTPPSLEGAFAWPGGGMNWGGGAYDPDSERLYVKTSNMPSPIRVAKFDAATSRNPFKEINRDPGYESVSAGRASVMGLPLTKPPYGKLTSVDMSSGAISWSVAMGRGSEAIRTNPALSGVKLPDRLGATGPAGGIVTKGGLVFVGGGDKGFYAFSKESGKELWSLPLPRVTSGTPMTYRSRSGRQFVLVATGSGDDASLVAYALPENSQGGKNKR
jgi:quinoprotein glucose dehydrogenase